MALNDITIVNEVTKRETAIGFDYTFPLALITTNTASNSLTTSPQVVPTSSFTVQFADITDVLGATDIEEYVDALALNRVYFNPDTRIDPELTKLIKYLKVNEEETLIIATLDIQTPI